MKKKMIEWIGEGGKLIIITERRKSESPEEEPWYEQEGGMSRC